MFKNIIFLSTFLGWLSFWARDTCTYYPYSYSYGVDGLCKQTVLVVSISHHPFVNLVLNYTDATSIHKIFRQSIPIVNYSLTKKYL